jgi:uncharacterized protein (DUF302 family)
MLFQVKTTKPLDEIERGLQESAARHQFGIIAIHDLKETLAKKGVDLAQQCRVYEVCNPRQAKRVLDADGAISTALPCRISVYGMPNQYTLATMRPTEMMKAFPIPGIETVAQEVEDVILQMMRDAAGESRQPGAKSVTGPMS